MLSKAERVKEFPNLVVLFLAESVQCESLAEQKNSSREKNYFATEEWPVV